MVDINDFLFNIVIDIDTIIVISSSFHSISINNIILRDSCEVSSIFERVPLCCCSPWCHAWAHVQVHQQMHPYMAPTWAPDTWYYMYSYTDSCPIDFRMCHTLLLLPMVSCMSSCASIPTNAPIHGPNMSTWQPIIHVYLYKKLSKSITWYLNL